MSEAEQAQWYLFRKGARRQGPFGGTELRQLAEDGRLNAHDYVWRAGLEQHLQAGDIPDLKRLLDERAAPQPIKKSTRAGPLAKAGSAPGKPDRPWDRQWPEATVSQPIDTQPREQRPAKTPPLKDEADDGIPLPEQAKSFLRSWLGRGSVKPATIIYLVLSFIVPLFPVSLVFFWYLAWRSYKK